MISVCTIKQLSKRVDVAHTPIANPFELCQETVQLRRAIARLIGLISARFWPTLPSQGASNTIRPPERSPHQNRQRDSRDYPAKDRPSSTAAFCHNALHDTTERLLLALGSSEQQATASSLCSDHDSGVQSFPSVATAFAHCGYPCESGLELK